MLRSEVNAAQRRAVALLYDLRFAPPPWVTWSPEEWAAQPGVAAYCRTRQMGWDVTDFGSGDFARNGYLPHQLVEVFACFVNCQCHPASLRISAYRLARSTVKVLSRATCSTDAKRRSTSPR